MVVENYLKQQVYLLVIMNMILICSVSVWL
uniref:Uncharacterized protein n=1 Tax=CrAss-like virus sp. ctRQZ5 TaxID=2826824 RepID=A0A8S5LXF3_9CAUD|nr:MAG TPA: hypothetical protein [CrAss-like virus sp. ctRQZ5]